MKYVRICSLYAVETDESFVTLTLCDLWQSFSCSLVWNRSCSQH